MWRVGYSCSGNPITVDLTGVGNAQVITVGLNCVIDGNGSGNMAVSLGMLLGDTNVTGLTATGL